MSEFADLKLKFSEHARPVRIPPDQVARIRSNYPNLPGDYFAFLETNGCGYLGALHLYRGPTPASEMLPQASHLEHVLLIGDDGLGYCFGFDTKEENRLVEVDPEGGILPLEENSLFEVVRSSLD